MPAPPFRIGAVSIDPPLVFAPMVGLSHSPLRSLVAELGRPGLFFSEMLSASRLPSESFASAPALHRTPAEFPLAHQLFAATPEQAERGARALLRGEGDIIDFNLACPAPAIAGKMRAGAFLLSDLGQSEAILQRLRRTVSQRPLTVKIRLGLRPDLVYLKDLCQMLEGCGVEAICLHPRLVGEKLKGRARWEYIGHLKTMSRLPVIGNGDVTSAADCRRLFAATGCDGVMIGRAAVQKPWLFGEICGRPFEASPASLLAIYLDCCRRITGLYPERRALGRIKLFTWYYAANLRFGHRFAAHAQGAESLAAWEEMTKRDFLPAA